MMVKAIETEWYQDYKLPSMFVAFPYCSFKCDKDSGERVCQNSALASAPTFSVDAQDIAKQYMENPITSAIIFGGLEPFDSFGDMIELIHTLRDIYYCGDTIVIFTGYEEEEIANQIEILRQYKNIIVKFGRFIPGSEGRYDNVLGVWLASKNQYAVNIC